MDSIVSMALTGASDIMQKIDEAEKSAYENLNAVTVIKKCMTDNIISCNQYKNIFTKLGCMEEILQNLQKESVESNKRRLLLQETNDSLMRQVQQLQEEKAYLEIQLSNCREVNKMLQEKTIGQSYLSIVNKSTRAQPKNAKNNALKDLEKVNRIQAQTQWLNERAASWPRQTSENACESSENRTEIPSSSLHPNVQTQIQENMDRCSPSFQSTTEPSEGQLTPNLLVQELKNQQSSISPSASIADRSALLDVLDSSSIEEKLNVLANFQNTELRRIMKDVCKMHGLKQDNKFKRIISEKKDFVCEMTVTGEKLNRALVATNHGPSKNWARLLCIRSILPQLVLYGFEIPATKEMESNNELLTKKMTELEKLNKLRYQAQWLKTHAASLCETSDTVLKLPPNATIVDPALSFNPTPPLQNQTVNLQNPQNIGLSSPVQQNMEVCAHNLENVIQQSKVQQYDMSISASIIQPAAFLQTQESENQSNKEKKIVDITKQRASESFTKFCEAHNLKPHFETISNGPDKTDFICETSVYVEELDRTFIARMNGSRKITSERLSAYSILLQMFCSGVKGLALAMTKRQVVEMLSRDNDKIMDSDLKSFIKTEDENTVVSPDGKENEKEISNLVLELFLGRKSIEVTKKNACTTFERFCSARNLKPHCEISNGSGKNGFTCKMSVFMKELGQTLVARMSEHKKTAARRSCAYSIFSQMFCLGVEGIALAMTKQQAVEMLSTQNARNTDLIQKSVIKAESKGTVDVSMESVTNGENKKATSNLILEPHEGHCENSSSEIAVDNIKMEITDIKNENTGISNSNNFKMEIAQSIGAKIPNAEFEKPVQNVEGHCENSSSEIAVDNIKMEITDIKNENTGISNSNNFKMEIAQSIETKIPNAEFEKPVQNVEENCENSNSEIAVDNIKMEITDIKNENTGISNSNDFKMEIAQSIETKIPNAEFEKPVQNVEEKRSGIGNVITNVGTTFNYFCIRNQISPDFKFTQTEPNSGFTCEISIPLVEHGQVLFAKEHRSSKKQARTACVQSIVQQLYGPNDHVNYDRTEQ